MINKIIEVNNKIRDLYMPERPEYYLYNRTKALLRNEYEHQHNFLSEL